MDMGAVRLLPRFRGASLQTIIGLDIAKSVFRAPRVGAFATAPSDGELADVGDNPRIY